MTLTVSLVNSLVILCAAKLLCVAALSRDPCQSFVCQNGGTCTAPADDPSCLCVPGIFGANCEFNRDPCFNFGCQNGGYCTAPADAPYCMCPDGFTGEKCESQIDGQCPTVDTKSFGICGGTFCDADPECTAGEKCCLSSCGRNLCTNVTSTKDQPVCSQGCPEGYTCEYKPYPCKEGMVCIALVVPTCVPPKDSCGGCPDGQVCKPTGIVCIRAPCPESFKCVSQKDSCGGCPDGQVCQPTGIVCITAPCNEAFKCVQVTTPRPLVACNLACIRGYECQLQVPTCPFWNRRSCNTRPVPKCVPKCPTIKGAQRRCPRWWKPGNTCKDDNDCRRNRNQRCCPTQCDWNVCTNVRN